MTEPNKLEAKWHCLLCKNVIPGAYVVKVMVWEPDVYAFIHHGTCGPVVCVINCEESVDVDE